MRTYWVGKPIFILALIFSGSAAMAGGPKFIAGTAYFDPAVVGQPIHWKNGAVHFFVDQGPLNSQIANGQAKSMVDAAAALWSSISTAAVTLSDSGTLNENVSSGNVLAGTRLFAGPADVTPSALNYPLAVVFDEDGSVIDALFGAGSSDPTSCQNNGVFTWLDNIRTDATIAHAVILLNGLCAANDNLVAMMQYKLERAFGRVLGLDYAQVNPGAAGNGEVNGMFGWPVMQPMSGACGAAGGVCIPNPGQLRHDDIAALNRMYPITSQNLASFPNKTLTSSNTVSIHGTISFQSGTGMQGVNVVARPLDAAGNPLYQYTVTAVSGALFSGNRGNPVTGWSDANGNPLGMWGSDDSTLQGAFDLSGIPLPPGTTSASYQVTFERIDPLYMLTNSVGPYVDGSPSPSGSMPTISLTNLSAGSSQMLAVNISDSAVGAIADAIASPAFPRMLAPSGHWVGRLGHVRQTDWFAFPVRAGRTFTVVTQALSEAGVPTGTKALPVIGVWDALKSIDSPSVGWAPPLNGYATGETWLQVTAMADDIVRLGIADLRGDGRPDYVYKGWVLYAEGVSPSRICLCGGPIVIRGMGFRPSDSVYVGGRRAVITSISPNEITAIAPPAADGVTGSVDVEVDDLPMFYALTNVPKGISYDSGNGDSLTLNSAPSGTVPLGIPIPFTVTALGPDLTPAGGVAVTWSVISGSATLSCGTPICTTSSSGDGLATVNVLAPTTGASVVIASLKNGASLQAHFTGGTPPSLASLTPILSVAAGATVSWVTQVLALTNGVPAAGQVVRWQSTSGFVLTGSSSAATDSTGIAAKSVLVGPLAEGQQITSKACINGTPQCVDFIVIGARPEFASLQAIDGTAQNLDTSTLPGQVALRVRDMNGNPMAGAAVSFFQSLFAWTPPCPENGRCAQAPILATQSSIGTSAVDGTVTFVPLALAGTASNLVGVATTGNSSTVPISIERHP